MKHLPYLFRYLMVLGIVLGISFGVHTWLRLQSDLWPMGDLLSMSYLFNFAMAYGIVAGLYFVRFRLKQQIGFLFIGGSLLKFLVFFLFFYPSFTADGTISRAEFSSFFVPYFLALATETYYTASMLKNLEKENPG
ncbi:MAG: hypothetical protein JSW57_04105 [Flavobacteriaceae bacterium]|nr:MAG: hypothetical protein JSW57_04105 [Flavobacteriaceae bacterium]